MNKFIALIIFFLIFSISFSQDLRRIKIETKKLEFNSNLSEIASDVVDGKLIYFQNKKAIKRFSQYYDLFMLDTNNLNSSRGDKDRINLTKQLTIVTNYHEGPCFVDEINNKIYITISALDSREMRKEKRENATGENRLRLLEGDFKDGIISNLKEFTYNNSEYNLGHATYSNATKRLYFVSSMPGSLGESDIFYCTKKRNGKWDTPVNLGRRVNSSESELFPYVKNGILFFSSNGQKRQVGIDLDLYYVKESEILTNNPTELKDANTTSNDYAICFNNKEKEFEGYFTSNRDNKFSGDDDVYSIKFTGVRFEKDYDLLVSVCNSDKQLKSGSATLINEEGKEIETVEIANDEFNFSQLEKGKEYRIEYNSGDLKRLFKLPINEYSSFVVEYYDIETDAIFNDTLVVDKLDVLVNKLNEKEKIIAKVEGTDKKQVEIPEKVKPQIDTVHFIKDTAIIASVKSTGEKKPEIKEETGTEVIKFDKKESFENIYFGFDSYVLFDKYKIKLDKLITVAKINKAKYIILSAYTDSRGSSRYNQKLSVKRALAARDYLIKNGIPESKIKYQGYGETNLINDCGNSKDCNEKKHAQNRRIEFTLAY